MPHGPARLAEEMLTIRPQPRSSIGGQGAAHDAEGSPL
jgi:hypothetical protein